MEDSFKEVYLDKNNNINGQIFTYSELKDNIGKYLVRDINKYDNVYSKDFIN